MFHDSRTHVRCILKTGRDIVRERKNPCLKNIKILLDSHYSRNTLADKIVYPPPALEVLAVTAGSCRNKLIYDVTVL